MTNALSLRSAARATRALGAAATGGLLILGATLAATPAQAASTLGVTSVAGAGAGVIGAARYSAPATALYVAPTGNDANSGTLSAPVRTLARAVRLAPAGATIVLRAGTYRESLTLTKAVTIQNYPGEAAWLDASAPVSGFTKVGTSWSAPWSYRFDHSPTDTFGAPDGTADTWTFVNPAYPLAAHPDMVWINGAEQRQVASAAAVVPGTFAVDETNGRLILGTDPTGKRVEGSTLAQAFSIFADNVTIRGIGIRRYADSVPHQGVLHTENKNLTLDRVAVIDSATAGVGIADTGAKLTNVTITGSGQLGLNAYLADGLVIDRSIVSGNNDEHFNDAPVAGGVKIVSTRDARVTRNELSGNDGAGVWTDEATWAPVITRNIASRNSGDGVYIEMSSHAIVAGNTLTDNGGRAVKVLNSDATQVINNTMSGIDRVMVVAQDSRTPQNSAYALDPRHRDDPNMIFLSKNNVVANNVIELRASAKQALVVSSVEDYTRSYDASELGNVFNGNFYSRQAKMDPQNSVLWAKKAAGYDYYKTVAQFTQGRGMERNSYQYRASVLDSSYVWSSVVRQRQGAIARPLPAAVATALGVPTTTRVLGAGL